MKMTLSTHHAAEILAADENANWSRAGALALVEYLEDLEESTREEIDFCRVAIRCDWGEYPGLRQWAEDYFGSITAWESALAIENDTLPDDVDDRIREYIEERGSLVEFDGGVIVSAF